MAEGTLSLVLPGLDCPTIPVSRFDPARASRGFDGQGLTHRVVRDRVTNTPLEWFYAPRSMVDGLRLAFGEQWRINVLPSTRENAGLFLLTQQWTGWRVLVRLGIGAYVADPITVPAPPRPNDEGESPVGPWCTHPTDPRGPDLGKGIDRAVSTAVRRKGWLSRAIRDSSAATEDLRALMRSVGIRTEQPGTVGDGLEEPRLLCAALVEVWLAENGYTGDEAEAVRTMVALRGLDALGSYERSIVESEKDGGR